MYDPLLPNSYERLRDWLIATQNMETNNTVKKALREGILEHDNKGNVKFTGSTNDIIERIKTSVGNDLKALKTEINTSLLKIVISLAICSGAAYWAYKEDGNQHLSTAFLLGAFALSGCIFFPCMELIEACKKNSEKEKKQAKIRACTVFTGKVVDYNLRTNSETTTQDLEAERRQHKI